jgi:hypothetical protein
MSVRTPEDIRRNSPGPRVEKNKMANSAILYEHGNQRVLQPHEIADAEKYANDWWSQQGGGNVNQDALQQTLGGRPKVVAGAAPSGYDQKNWDNPNMQSVKYDAGRFLAGKRRPSEVAAMVNSPEFQARFKGATFDGKDRVNFNGALSDGTSGVPVYDIDVLMAADREGDSSNGFWWGHDVEGMNKGPATGAPGAVRPPTSNTLPIASGGQSDLLAQVMAALQQDPDTQALLQQAMR